jgi:hypothetical protein
MTFIKEVGTHSLKATTLSWCAKRGVSPSHRKILGYHLDKEEVSMATYSRDVVAAPLRELERVLGQVRRGSFMPDSSRSGYLEPRAVASGGGLDVAGSPGDHHDGGEDEHDEQGGSSTSSSTTDGSPDLCVDEEFGQAVLGKDKSPVDLSSRKVYQHAKSGMLHAAASTGPRLACGRVLTRFYSRLRATSVSWPLCRNCELSVGMPSSSSQPASPAPAIPIDS